MSNTLDFEHKIHQEDIASNFQMLKAAVQDRSSPLFDQENNNALETILLIAIARGEIKIVMYLLTQPLVIEYMQNIPNLSQVLELILYTAVIHNQHEIVTQLLEQKILEPFENSNTKNPFNCTLCLNQASEYAKQYNYDALEQWLNRQINESADPVHSNSNWI